jgi:hypothetical protein
VSASPGAAPASMSLANRLAAALTTVWNADITALSVNNMTANTLRCGIAVEYPATFFRISAVKRFTEPVNGITHVFASFIFCELIIQTCDIHSFNRLYQLEPDLRHQLTGYQYIHLSLQC